MRKGRKSAERPERPLADYLGEIAWALLVFNLILAAVSLLFTPHLGAAWSFAVFLGFGLAITVLLLAVVGVNLLADWLYRKRRAARAAGKAKPHA